MKRAHDIDRVSAGRVPLFCDTGLAGRVERTEAHLIALCQPGRPPPGEAAERGS